MALTGNSFFRLFRKLRMGGDGVSVRTLTGNLSLTVLEEQLCAYDPGGASRNVTIHVDDNVVGNMRMFYNSADADGENLVIKNSAGTTIVTIGRGETGVVAYGGSTPAWTKMLLTDGTADVFSTANSWSAEQTFGAGIALLDSDNITLGTGDDDTISHDGTNTIWTHATGNLLLDNTSATGATYLDLGTDTSATKVAMRNNSGTEIVAAIGNSTSEALGLRTKGTTAAAITGVTVLALSDSGGVFSVSQGAAYDIDLPSPTTGPGCRYLFYLTGAAANNVTITVAGGAATFVGTIVNDVTSVLPATGSTLTFASGVAALGDNIEIVSISTTLYLVRAVTSANGGITVS